MIVLNTGKELVRLECWDDIEGRPGYSGDLDPSQHKLSGIIGQYRFGAQIRCGLSNCHTPHNHGYLVVTQSGLETNIGKDCGRRYFGVDFETMEAAHLRDMREKLERENVWNFMLRLEDVQRKVQDLLHCEQGGSWVYKTSRALVEANKGVPTDIVRAIAVMIKTGKAVLTRDRPATQRETELAEASGTRVSRPHLITEKVADIQGLEALREENDLRQLLVLNLDQELRALEALDADTMSPRDLRQWSKWVNTVDATLERAEAAIEAGRALLTADNLLPFREILRDPSDAPRFDAYLKGLRKASL